MTFPGLGWTAVPERRACTGADNRLRWRGDCCGKLADLLPMVRNYVYHPQFHGSFSIESVLPAMFPGLGYSELAVASGDVAALEL